MSDLIYNWDEINLDEAVSEIDIKKASFEKVPGSFVCIVGEPKMTTKTTSDYKDNNGKLTSKGYMSYALDLDLTVESVLAIEKQILDDKQEPLVRNGKVQTRIAPLTETEKAEQNALFSGMIISDQVRMLHEDEKTGTANKRIKVAVALGILKAGKPITSEAWKNIGGTRVIINTVRNSWEKDGATQTKIKVDFFNGYEVYIPTGQPEEKTKPKTDFGDI